MGARQYIFSKDAESALEIATDAVLRRARLLEGTEPGVAQALRNLTLRLEPWMATGASIGPTESSESKTESGR